MAQNLTCGALDVFLQSAFHFLTPTSDRVDDKLKKESSSQDQAASQFPHATDTKIATPAIKIPLKLAKMTSSSRYSTK